MAGNVKGGSLGYDVFAAKYRQHFLIFNLTLLVILYFIMPQAAEVAAEPAGSNLSGLVTGSLVFVLAIMAVWQYGMDGYAIKHLRLKETKLFGN